MALYRGGVTVADLQSLLAERSATGGGTLAAAGPQLFTGTRLRYRREFIDATLGAFEVSAGSGMSVTAGTGTLTVTTGTTANQTTTVTTRQRFTAPFKASFGFRISQKLATQDFFVEAVAVNPDGSLDESCVAAWRVSGADSVTTTVARVETRNGGPVRSTSGNLTTQTQTTDGIFDIVVDSEEVQFHGRGMDSTSARSVSSIRNSVAPDPNREFVLRYRIVNGATAPASTTTFTSQFLTAVDYTEIQTEVTAGPGIASAAAALPVVAAGGSVTVTSSVVNPSSTGTGTTVAKVLSAASTNATLVKNSAARLYGYRLANTNATTWRYMKLYNLTTVPVPGTSAVVYTIPIPPGQSIETSFTHPITHATGLGYAITAGPADNDTAAVAASEVIGHLLFL